MGHNTLGVLPRSKRWRPVVELLGSEAGTPEVISASATAAEGVLLRATDDPVFIEAVRLLLNIPLAARADDFGRALRDADLKVPNRPELFDIIAAVTERLDTVSRAGGRRSDLGELAGRALAATLATSIGDALPGLFGASPEDVQAIARKLSWSKGIAAFSQDFFGRLVSQTLSYWLDRTLSTHIGADLRFRDPAARSKFDVELDHLSSEATRIIKEFSGGWYGKTLSQRRGFGSREAAIFGGIALKKIVAELRVRNAEHD